MDEKLMKRGRPKSVLKPIDNAKPDNMKRPK